MRRSILSLLLVCLSLYCLAEDGYKLWLRYQPVSSPSSLQQYRSIVKGFDTYGNAPTLDIAKNEFRAAIKSMLGIQLLDQRAPVNGSVLAFSKAAKPAFINLTKEYDALGKEGFLIRSINNGKNKLTIITANSEVGVLYGTFHLLRLMQTGQDIRQLNISSTPKIQNRILNHWDNLDRHVERGYAGISIWNWHTLPGYIDKRYIDYARANASIGINGTVLTNVNANALVLTQPYLEKVAALANVFRPYGIKVYLTARFSAPIEIGKLKTADPHNPEVQAWWKEKAAEIYSNIPDFGGFLVKANSEGQPGPQNYGRTHADGANMLADAVTPFGGIVMWRAFVYSHETPVDRISQAYNEFKPFDGQFRKNVLIQVKNGPLDFQPREPFSPLFGAMPKTPLMMEFQITQEYLGQGTQLAYEAPMFKEVLEADTRQKGRGSTVARVIDGTLHNYPITGIAGVSNIGNDINWTGHPFGQSNWYAFGRLAWDHSVSSSAIADEWIRQSFTHDPRFLSATKNIMLSSHDVLVNYMTPLGLTHIMGTGHHYGPAPWVDNAGRDDWNPVYYHRADSFGIGFDRTVTGSNAVAQYAPEVKKIFENINTCPEEYLLWFHHVGWNHKMKSGRTLWEELCYRYYSGVDSMRAIRKQWDNLKGYIDDERFTQVQMLLDIQVKEAVWWRNACLLYFQTFSRMPIPPQYEKPDRSLEYYKSLRFPYAPGHG